MEILDVSMTFLQEVHKARQSRYIDIPYPCTLDDRIQSLIEAYCAATVPDRIALSSSLDCDASNCLWTFAKRSATQSVRRNSEAFLFDGLLALIIEDLREDDRETTMVMSVMINAAVRIGVDPIALIERAVLFATPNTAERILSIGNRYRETKNSSLMGFRAEMTAEGFSYF